MDVDMPCYTENYISEDNSGVLKLISKYVQNYFYKNYWCCSKQTLHKMHKNYTTVHKPSKTKQSILGKSVNYDIILRHSFTC